MIEFRKLVLYNFMSYRGKTVVQLAKQGIVRIEGINKDEPGSNSNMAGKSTIMEALLWCLFGRTLRGLKHESIINRKAKRNCFVSTTFVSNGTIYTCRRNRRHSRFQNKLQLYRKDVPLSSRHGDDTQARLESILDVNFESFVNSTVFGGFDGQRKQFALQTDSQQKQVLDSFLQFEKFDLAHKRTKNLLIQSKEKYHELQLQIQAQHGRVVTLQEKAKTLKKSEKIFKDNEKGKRRRLRRDIRALRISGRKASNACSKRDVVASRQRLENFLSAQAVVEEKLNVIKTQLKSFTKKQLNQEKLIDRPCPACGRLVKESTLSSFLEHLSREKKRLRIKKRVVEKVIISKQEHVKSERRRLIELEKKLTNATNIYRQRMELELQLNSLKTQAPFSVDLEIARKNYSREVSRLLALKYEESLLSNKIKGLQFWEVGFGSKGVKTLIIKQVLPAMNNKLKEYADEIFQSGHVELEFRTTKTLKGNQEDKELFHLHYKSKFNAVNYVGESSGGRRRIDICVLLVFSWLSRCSNLLLVDELLDGLDNSGRETVLNILARRKGTILVISHSKELSSKIGKVWTVTKQNGVSELEVE